MTEWPPTLPVPSLNGFKVKKRNKLLRTDMSAGLTRQRRVFVGKIYDFDVSWRFSKTEKAIFDAWFEDEIFSGAAWFSVQLTMSGALQSFTARFIPESIDESALNGLNWDVTAKLEAVHA